MTLWESIADFFNRNAIKAVSVIATVLFFFILLKIFKRALNRIYERKKIDKIVINFINSLLYIVFIIIAAVAVFDMLNVSTTSFVTILGAVGLALSLSLQDSLSNIASGLLIIITKPFKQEDYISIGSLEGNIKKINLLTTEIYTYDNKKIIIPNNKLTGTEITNYTSQEQRRLDLEFNTGYTEQVEKVKKIFFKAVDKHEKVLKAPQPLIRLNKLTDYSLNFAVKVWVKTPDYWTVYFDLQEQILEALNKEGIKVPYKTLDVNIYK